MPTNSHFRSSSSISSPIIHIRHHFIPHFHHIGMWKDKKVLWLCGLIFLSSVQGRTVVQRPRSAQGAGQDARDLWGYSQIWDDQDPSFPGLCSLQQQFQYPSVPIIPGVAPRPNQFGGFPGNSLGIYNPRPSQYPVAPYVPNQFGGYSGQVSPALNQQGYPVNAPETGFVPVSNEFGDLSAGYRPSPGIVNPSLGYGPYTGIVPTSGSVGGYESSFSNSDSTAEQTSFDHSQESSNSASGQSNSLVGIGNGPYSNPGLGVIGAQGSQFNTANSNEESTNFQQHKESVSSSAGNYGAINSGFGNVVRPGIVPGVPSPLVLGSTTYAHAIANSQKEITNFQQHKESASSSSGLNTGFYGANNQQRPYGYPQVGQVVSAEGSQFNTQNSASESTAFEQNQQSASSSSGQSGQFLDGTGQLPHGYGGQGQIVSAGGSQFNTQNSASESTAFQQNKESASSAQGSNSSLIIAGTGSSDYDPLLAVGSDYPQASIVNAPGYNYPPGKDCSHCYLQAARFYQNQYRYRNLGQGRTRPLQYY